MSHSPLETVILFHVGIVPISGTVVNHLGIDRGADGRKLDGDPAIQSKLGN